MTNKPTYEMLLKYTAELEDKVRQLEAKLEENRLKTERIKAKFLSSVSHELRTPMNAILGFSNLLIDKNVTTEKKEEYMEHINQSGNSLLTIVDSMIDASLLEVNELRINKERVNLNLLVQQVYHYYNIDKHKLGKDHIAILLNKGVRKEEFIITTDHYRLTQVLSSLLNNALKFTSKGIIEFGYSVREEDRKIQFFVKDSGKGVLAEKAGAIFNKFEKQDEDYGTTEGGVGLGLTLARGIIQLLGGDIWVESNIFHGSTFNFTIDYLEKHNELESNKQSIKSISILV
jgi:signal transduction histidine kinase